MTTPSKPSLQTCAELIRAAQTEISRHQDAGDKDEHVAATAAFVRAFQSARGHGYSAKDIQSEIAKLNAT